MSDLISTQEAVVKVVDTAIQKIMSGEQKLTKEYEQSVKDAVNVILNTSRRTYGDLIERQDAMNVTKRLLGDSEISRTMQTALRILPSAQPVDEAYLIDWYISSVDDSDPVWTEAHIEELMNDFYLIPKGVY